MTLLPYTRVPSLRSGIDILKSWTLSSFVCFLAPDYRSFIWLPFFSYFSNIGLTNTCFWCSAKFLGKLITLFKKAVESVFITYLLFIHWSLSAFSVTQIFSPRTKRTIPKFWSNSKIITVFSNFLSILASTQNWFYLLSFWLPQESTFSLSSSKLI